MIRLIRALGATALLSVVMAVPALADQHTCANYPSQAAAQAALPRQPQLDRDRDGIACEGNPAPFAGGATAGSQEAAAPATMPRTGAGGMADDSPAGAIAVGAGALLLAGLGAAALRDKTRRRSAS